MANQNLSLVTERVLTFLFGHDADGRGGREGIGEPESDEELVAALVNGGDILGKLGLDRGTSAASASTTALGDGGFFHITGTATIAAITFTNDWTGRKATLVFDGVLTLTHNASTLILPTAANIITEAGDSCDIVSEGGGAIRMTAYRRADGTTLVADGSFVAATATEALAGTNAVKGVTPLALAAIWEKGSDIASAATISIGAGGYFHITGTTGISDIDFGTDKSGRAVVLVFDGALTLTHSATLILPTAANITTVAGDSCLVVSEGSDAVRVVMYHRRDGTPLTGTGVSTASTTDILTGTDTSKAATPDSIAALWEKGANIASAATLSIGEGGFFHVTGVTGITDIDFGTDKTGRRVWLVFDGALVLTHNASTLILPGGANITTAAGDAALVVSEGTDAVKVLAYIKAAGSPLVLADAAGVPVFSNIPQNSKSAAYTLVVGDAQGHIYHPSADTTARIWTIPSNAAVPFPIGTAITFVNDTGAGAITIAITTDTLVLSPTGLTGSRTLAANGNATALKMTATRWQISGPGLS